MQRVSPVHIIQSIETHGGLLRVGVGEINALQNGSSRISILICMSQESYVESRIRDSKQCSRQLHQEEGG